MELECPFALIVLKELCSGEVIGVANRMQRTARRAEREQVRAHYAARFYSSPLYRNRPAAQVPGYWNRFNSGIVNM